MTGEERLFGGRPERTRWLFVLVGIVINLCLGSVYAYSIFKPAVEKVHGVKALMGNLPFMAFLLFFSISMFFSGRLMGRLGPRRLALVGGIVVGLGWLLSSLAGSLWALVLTYGVVAGSGVGMVYGCPVAMGARWFPDRKGLAVGLMLAGFGGSALITGKIASALIGNVAAQLPPALAGSLSHAFMSFGVAFAIILVLLALPLRFPAAGWRPAGWEPKVGVAAGVDFAPSQMARTTSFWGLFLCYVIGCLAGLMAIGISLPVGRDVIRITSESAAALVGVFAAFNAIGRPLFGWLTDRITPRGAAVVNLCIILVMSVFMIMAGEGSTGLYTVSFIGFWLCLGGWLAIAPTATATFFGMKHNAGNYGLVFFAYGLGAILGGVISGKAADMFGTYTYAFYPTAVLAAVGIVLAVLLIKPPRPAAS